MSSYARQRAFEASQRQKKLEAENARQAGLLQSQGSDDAAIQSLLGQYVNQDPGNTIGSAEFGKIRDFAFSNAEDPVFAAQRGAAGTAAEAQRARTRADALAALQGQDRSLAGQTANAYSQLAMGGGLSSGSRERIAAGAANQNLMARQNLRGEEMRGLTSIGTAEQGALGELGVAEAKARQDAQMRVTDALAKEEARRVQLRQDILGKKLETEGALLKAKRETAISEQNKPSEGSWLCTAVGAEVPFGAAGLEGLKALKDYAAQSEPTQHDLYMARFPLVIEAMRESHVDLASYKQELDTIAEMALVDAEAAFERYKDLAIELIEEFYPDFFQEGAA